MKIKRVLILGHLGFLGNSVIRHLANAEGIHVFGLDVLPIQLRSGQPFHVNYDSSDKNNKDGVVIDRLSNEYEDVLYDAWDVIIDCASVPAEPYNPLDPIIIHESEVTDRIHRFHNTIIANNAGRYFCFDSKIGLNVFSFEETTKRMALSVMTAENDHLPKSNQKLTVIEIPQVIGVSNKTNFSKSDLNFWIRKGAASKEVKVDINPQTIQTVIPVKNVCRVIEHLIRSNYEPIVSIGYPFGCCISLFHFFQLASKSGTKFVLNNDTTKFLGYVSLTSANFDQKKCQPPSNPLAEIEEVIVDITNDFVKHF